MRLDPKIFFALLCLPFLLSCSFLPFWKEEPPDVPEWLRKGDMPKKVAVLPFDNLTSDPELEELVRRSFYSHFALKRYRDIEVTEVDRALRILQADSLRQWRDLPPPAFPPFPTPIFKNTSLGLAIRNSASIFGFGSIQIPRQPFL